MYSTFEFLPNRTVDEEVDRGVEDEKEMVETHHTKVPGRLSELGLTPKLLVIRMKTSVFSVT